MEKVVRRLAKNDAVTLASCMHEILFVVKAVFFGQANGLAAAIAEDRFLLATHH